METKAHFFFVWYHNDSLHIAQVTDHQHTLNIDSDFFHYNIWNFTKLAITCDALCEFSCDKFLSLSAGLNCQSVCCTYMSIRIINTICVCSRRRYRRFAVGNIDLKVHNRRLLWKGDCTSQAWMSTMDNRHAIEQYFAVLKESMEKYDLTDKPSQIYNFDEVGMPGVYRGGFPRVSGNPFCWWAWLSQCQKAQDQYTLIERS